MEIYTYAGENVEVSKEIFPKEYKDLKWSGQRMA